MRINYRNHRKNVVVDGRMGWTGGIDVGVEYLGQDPKFGHWRDTQLKVEGPAVSSLALIFQEDWLWATGEVLAIEPPSPIEEPGNTPALLMATGPADKFEACAIAFSDMIAQARHRLWVVSPYFVPDTDMRTALYAAQLRGVDVRIMLPGEADHLLVWLASNAHADAMVSHGVGVYRYHRGFLHQKVLLMDNKMASVGSVNFDNRSFAINFEMTVWMRDPRVVKDVEKMLLRDFTDCREVTREDVQRRGTVRRFRGRADQVALANSLKNMIKVASYNIRKSLGTDRKRSPDRIFKILEELDAGVHRAAGGGSPFRRAGDDAVARADRRFDPLHAGALRHSSAEPRLARQCAAGEKGRAGARPSSASTCPLSSRAAR